MHCGIAKLFIDTFCRASVRSGATGDFFVCHFSLQQETDVLPEKVILIKHYLNIKFVLVIVVIKGQKSAWIVIDFFLRKLA